MINKSTNFNNAENLIGILIAIVVAVSFWLFVNLSPWIAAGFAISAVSYTHLTLPTKLEV